jgi:uncharacterized protein YjbI with pentapeptide repeats
MASGEHLARLKEAIERNDIAVWNNWRQRQPYAMPDLSDADLSGVYLQGADMRNASLLGADLSDANLINANLSKAKLHGAQLSKADLSEADPRAADLLYVKGLVPFQINLLKTGTLPSTTEKFLRFYVSNTITMRA